jgi:hypothetical protein
VLFLANNVAVAGAVTLSSGAANYSWVTSCANLGQNVITAAYSGDVNYQGSKGPTLFSGEAGNTGGAGISSNGSVVVTPLEVQVTNNNCPDFSIDPSSTSFTVAAGGTIPPVTITAAAINGFTGTVTFSATVTSTSGYAPTLTFSPTSVVIPSATESTTLTLSGITADLRMPNAPGKFDSGPMLARHSSSRAPWYAGSGVTIASLLLVTLPRRRRRLGGLLLVALAVALIGGATGCGGSSQTGPPTTTSNPYVGVYSVIVVGTYTSGSVVTTHSQTVTYIIN